jgi:hypothetical protein
MLLNICPAINVVIRVDGRMNFVFGCFEKLYM